jgi:hypothetical protein
MPLPPLTLVEERVIPIPRKMALDVNFQHPYRDSNSGRLWAATEASCPNNVTPNIRLVSLCHS